MPPRGARRGVADGPRKTLNPTINAGKPKRQTNKNETTEGKNDAGRDQNYRNGTTDNQRRPPGKRHRRCKNKSQRDQNTKSNRRYANPADRPPIFDFRGAKSLPSKEAGFRRGQ